MSDHELSIAICEAHAASAADAYFSARASTVPGLDTPQARRLFDAAFQRGWEARAEACSMTQPVRDDSQSAPIFPLDAHNGPLFPDVKIAPAAPMPPAFMIRNACEEWIDAWTTNDPDKRRGARALMAEALEVTVVCDGADLMDYCRQYLATGLRHEVAERMRQIAVRPPALTLRDACEAWLTAWASNVPPSAGMRMDARRIMSAALEVEVVCEGVDLVPLCKQYLTGGLADDVAERIKQPLAPIERDGLMTHGMARYIGKPSQLADAFRQGVAWAQLTDAERAEALKRHQRYQVEFARTKYPLTMVKADDADRY